MYTLRGRRGAAGQLKWGNMTDNSENAASRRTALASVGAFGAAGIASLFIGKANAATPTAAESANIKLVKDYMAAWIGPNPKLEDLVADLAENCFITINPGPPQPLVGRDTVKKVFEPLLALGEGFELQVTEAHALGPAVFIKRIDYTMKGGKRDDEGTEAVGLLIIENGKIKYWHDYVFTAHG